MDFMLGSDYENIRPLDAKGGMGDLFRAHKKGLDVEVVIKRIKRKYIGRLDQQNEANILKGLKHQYLPRIYDVIPGEDGCLYTIMDYIPGVDLQQYVKQNGCVPQPVGPIAGPPALRGRGLPARPDAADSALRYQAAQHHDHRAGGHLPDRLQHLARVPGRRHRRPA